MRVHVGGVSGADSCGACMSLVTCGTHIVYELLTSVVVCAYVFVCVHVCVCVCGVCVWCEWSTHVCVFNLAVCRSTGLFAVTSSSQLSLVSATVCPSVHSKCCVCRVRV